MYRLTEEQAAVVTRLRNIADQHIAPYAQDVDENSRFPKEAFDALGKEGFLGLTVSQEFGGMGEGIRTAAAVVDEIAQRCASTAMCYIMHLCGISVYSARADVAEKQLREAAQGNHVTTLAWSEKGSRSHFWAPVSQAVANNGHLRISAQKSWVTSAGYADGYVVSTKSPMAQSATDSMLFLVLKEDKGIEVSGSWNALGMRGNASAPMSLDNVELTPDRAFTEEGKGMDMMLGVVLPWFQIGNAATSVGICEAATQATQRHLTTAKFDHLGSTLADLPNLRARLAQMRIETDRARAHLVSVLDAVENPSPATMLMVLEAKAAAGETALSVTDIGMRACGGAAFSKHLPVERCFRDARASVVMAPTADVIHDFIGKALCGIPLF
ncbi:MAG: acyl-CoA/acyl-ACP dehydrogenase [Armatimonadetes bacterium]|nr:acyl-CoA dehydrogenase [Armatimonadota bacterium]NOG92869.1 acyl-CoA/acyl-ACP dehydrogenase [Armatimonadota bacterium]